MLYQDIPRIYTAIAEWGACLVYLYMLKREKMKSAHFLIGSVAYAGIAVCFSGLRQVMYQRFYGFPV